MAGACGLDAWRGEGCRDSAGAMQLKLISIGVIFVTSVVGISSPVVLARVFQGKPVYDKAVLVIKCFAAGVILSTSLVHVLPDAFQALSDCQVASRHPWRDFPFTGLFTLIGSLLALFVDVTATSHVNVAHCTTTITGNNNHKSSSSSSSAAAPYIRLGTTIASSPPKKKKSGDYELGSATIGRQEEGYGGTGPVQEDDDEGQGEVAATVEKMKQRLVSQVLEIGIIFHSVIIGVTLGMSQNRCTIKPLVAALAFHQIFEGMGLGGCIAQAGFKFRTTVYMCVMFSVTTPFGILLGMMVFAVTGYDDNSPGALISEGILGSLSSGVLIYMALVDLIAADFFHNKMMDSTRRLKKVSFVALTLGSASMSILALWA